MGLIEQIRSGSVFSRGTVTLSNSPAAKGTTTEFGATYILLGIEASNPCRVRLYGISGSVAVDELRPSSSFDYSASVALNLDAGLTPSQLSINFNPPIIALAETSSITAYNIESTTTPTTVNISYYPLEVSDLVPSRTFLNIPSTGTASLGANTTSSGNIPSDKSFVIWGVVNSNNNLRLRLYSRPIDDISSAEKSRPFISQSADGSHLIADMLLDSGSFPVSPALQAYNLESYISGSNRVGYILENLSGSTQTNIRVGVRTFRVEN